MKRITPSDLWKSPVIKKRLLDEACFESDHGVSEKKHYWIMAPQADSGTGYVGLKNYETSLVNIDPHELQQNFAMSLMEKLMKEAHFDGLWIVGFTHPPGTYDTITGDNAWNRLIFIWLDQHGDPQYTMESDLPFIKQAQAGVDYYVGLAHQGHKAWLEQYGPKAMKSDMMLKDSQIHSPAMEALKH